MSQQILTQAIEHAQAGRRVEARELFLQVVQAEPNNEVAWHWLAAVAATPGEYDHALSQVLRINPNNQQARDELNAYRASYQPPVAPPVAPSPPVYGGPAYASPAYAAPMAAYQPRATYSGSAPRGHVFIFGLLGLLIFGVFSYIGFWTESVPVTILLAILTPIVIGFLGAYAGIGNGAVRTIGKGAMDGGCTAIVTAGVLSSLCGAVTMLAASKLQDEITFTGEIGILDFTDIGAGFMIFVVLLLVGYFLFGLIGGLVAAYSKGLS